MAEVFCNFSVALFGLPPVLLQAVLTRGGTPVLLACVSGAAVGQGLFWRPWDWDALCNPPHFSYII